MGWRWRRSVMNLGGPALAPLLLALMAIASPARGAPPNEECLTCHAQDLRVPGRGSLHVDAGALAASTHAALPCAACHTDATAIPHASRLASVRCQSCHAGEARTLVGSVHGRVGTPTRTGVGEAATRATGATSDGAP